MRLQPRIEELVDASQTGFVKNKQITEGFIYTQHTLHHTHQQNIPLAIFKVDIRKAFDTVSWEYMLKIMQNMNFSSAWLTWIKNLVLSGTSQTLINGLLGKKLILKRGVRQGDPVSPYLFIISMDFLSRWFQRLRDTGAICLPFPGMKPCLLYADDALLFLKLYLRHMHILKIAFTTFHQISGLEVNFQKSELLLSRGTQQLGQQLATSMGCNLGQFPFTYLGLPLSNRRLRQHTCH